MEHEEITLEEFVEEINEEVREKFNKLERKVSGFTGIVLGGLSLSPLLFTFILMDKFNLGMIVYFSGVFIYNIIFRIAHKLFYGKVLDMDYQWGNESFENLEQKMLNTMYSKESIDDEEYDCYFSIYEREVVEDDYFEYKQYKKRIIKFNIIATLITLAPSILFAIKTIKSL